MNEILIYALVALAGFVTGVFVYRNNVDLFTPFANKMDAKFEEMEQRLKKEIRDRK